MKQEALHLETNPDLASSLAAMHRAAAPAHEVVIQTGTEIIIVEDGKRVRIAADDLRVGRVGR